MNAQIEKMFGYNRNEVIGQQIEMLIPERYHESHVKLRTEFLSGPSVRAIGAGRELYGRKKDGSEFNVEVGLTPISNFIPEDPESIVVIASLTDITERKSQEENFRIIVEAAPNGMVMVNSHGNEPFILSMHRSTTIQLCSYFLLTVPRSHNFG